MHSQPSGASHVGLALAKDPSFHGTPSGPGARPLLVSPVSRSWSGLLMTSPSQRKISDLSTLPAPDGQVFHTKPPGTTYPALAQNPR